MATLENLEDPGALQAFLEGLDEGSIIGQQISHQGAIHALEFALSHGGGDDLILAMLINLRSHFDLVVAVAQRKGFKRVFDRNYRDFH